MAKHETIQKAIKSLAVSYHAYLNAVAESDSNGIIVWGECLIEDQEATGVEMLPASSVSLNIKFHREDTRKQLARVAE